MSKVNLEPLIGKIASTPCNCVCGWNGIVDNCIPDIYGEDNLWCPTCGQAIEGVDSHLLVEKVAYMGDDLYLTTSDSQTNTLSSQVEYIHSETEKMTELLETCIAMLSNVLEKIESCALH